MRRVQKQYGWEVALLTLGAAAGYTFGGRTLELDIVEMQSPSYWVTDMYGMPQDPIEDPAGVHQLIDWLTRRADSELTQQLVRHESAVLWLAKEFNRALRRERQMGNEEYLHAQLHATGYMHRCLHDVTANLGELVDWVLGSRPDLMSLDACEALAASRAWHDDLRARASEEAVVAGEPVFEWSDGWRIEELSTRKQLQAEGCALGHCVGGEYYWQQVQAGETEIYSLRDPDGRPRLTIELAVDEGRNDIVQVKGWGNRIPGEHGKGFDQLECARLREWADGTNRNVESDDMNLCYTRSAPRLGGREV
jgi:hypothetical protein